MIEVEAEAVNAVRALRRVGVGCYLTTNQAPHRARHMSETLGYAGLFDRELYSCQMGLVKPDPEYFRSILREIKIQPGNVLFIDDHQVNVDSARGVGLHAVAITLEAGPDPLHHTLREFGISVD